MISRHPWGGLADPEAAEPADVAILGVPYDGSACWREGAAEAPGRLRAISATSPAVSEEGYVVDPARFTVRDLGDVGPDAVRTSGGAAAEAARQAYFNEVEGVAREALSRNRFLLSLGGDHSVTIPLVRAFAARGESAFGLVLLDAHPDQGDP